MSEPTPHTSPLALWRAIQRLKAQAAQLESIVSVINGDGGGGGGDAFDDTTGVATLTGNRGWDGAATHNVSISGAEAAIRGDTNIKLVTPGIIATAVSTGWVLTVTDASTGAVEFQEAASGSYLPLSGGTMSGAINMGSQKINTLGTPTANADATTKLYVDQNDGIIQDVVFSSGAVVSGVVNDLNIGSTTANRVSYDFSITGDGPLTLTGVLAPTYNNRILYFVNTRSKPIQLAFSDARSAAANRITSGSGITTIGYLETVVFQYRTSTSRWYPIHKIPSPLSVTRELVSAGSYIASGGIIQDFTPFSFLRNTYGFNLIALGGGSGATDSMTVVAEMFNVSGGSVIIEHDTAPGGAIPTTWGILTPTSTNITWPHLTLARFAYDHVALRWRLLNTPA